MNKRRPRKSRGSEADKKKKTKKHSVARPSTILRQETILSSALTAEGHVDLGAEVDRLSVWICRSFADERRRSQMCIIHSCTFLFSCRLHAFSAFSMPSVSYALLFFWKTKAPCLLSYTCNYCLKKQRSKTHCLLSVRQSVSSLFPRLSSRSACYASSELCLWTGGLLFLRKYFATQKETHVQLR